MANFKQAFKKTAAHEGVYSNNRRDRGGETVFGIARKRWPHWVGWQVVDQLRPHEDKLSLTEELAFVNRLKTNEQLYTLAEGFYKVNFWNELYLDGVKSQAIAEELYDTAVNQGTEQAAKYLQQSLNYLNDNQRIFSDLKIDGLTGPKTLKALESYWSTSLWPSRSQSAVEKTLLKCLDGLQFERYKDIVENDPTQETFFYGWINTRIA